MTLLYCLDMSRSNSQQDFFGHVFHQGDGPGKNLQHPHCFQNLEEWILIDPSDSSATMGHRWREKISLEDFWDT